MSCPTPVTDRCFGIPREQTGVGLIEVLVAILVLSIGLLGMAALQSKALSTNNSAMTRSVAVLATYSILDAMRADRTNALAGNYNLALTANACPNNQNSLADNQLHDWCLQLQRIVPTTATTTGTINCLATGACTITIQFDDSHAGTSNVAGTPTVGLNNQTVVTNAML